MAEVLVLTILIYSDQPAKHIEATDATGLGESHNSFITETAKRMVARFS